MAHYIAICSTNWWNNEANQGRYVAYYNSLSAWVSARAGTLTDDEIVEIQGDDWATTGYDTSPVNLNGFVCSMGGYQLVITAIGLARHLGVWDTSRYILKLGTTTSAFTVPNTVDNLVIDGLQIENTRNDNYLGTFFTSSTNASAYCVFGNNICYYSGAANSASNITGFNSVTNYGAIYNNIFVAASGGANNTWIGIKDTYGNCNIYNNTVIGFGTGIHGSFNNVVNNLCMDCGTPYNVSGTTDISYNAYDTGTDPGLYGVDLAGYDLDDIFTDPANLDFSLLETAIALRQKGANLTSDSDFAFSEDIAGQELPAAGAWDLGAWYYSGSAVGDPVTITILNAVDGTRIIIETATTGEVVVEAFEIDGTSVELTYEYFEDVALKLKARKSSSGDAIRYLPLIQYQQVTNRGCTFYLDQREDPVLN